MKKIMIAFGIIIITILVIFNLPKNTPKEIMVKEQPTVMNKDSSPNKMEKVDMTQTNSSRYINYSKTLFDQMSDKKRVYFFHAKWCPTCKAANEEFMQNIDKISKDIVLFKTDYDTEKELKTQYGITYQHTFVYVDSQGKEIKKWNGGGVSELISNTIQ
jgi:thiol-disulfide isomerase/thioredoxin